MKKFANRLNMIAEYFSERPKRVIYPQEVVVELTNHCNLSCVMCPQPSMKRAKGFMDEALFQKIIDEIRGRSELVYLYGTGESLLHKALIPYTRYACDSGLTTCLSTNGIPLTGEIAENLLDTRLDYLIIALDGGVRETYESIRVGGDFDRLLGNIKRLLRLRKEKRSRVKIVLQMIYMPGNAHETTLFRELFTREELDQIFQLRFKPHYETYSGRGSQICHTRPCYWLWNMLAIAHNGAVQLCCMDYEADITGLNARDTTISGIWNSETFKRYRRWHRQMDYAAIPLCERCDIPEQGYFNNALILGSALLNAGQVRMLLPLYEKLLLWRSKPNEAARNGCERS